MKDKLVVILLAVLFISCPGRSISGEYSGPINIQAGITVFDDPTIGPDVYIEFPFSVNRNQFKFAHEEGVDFVKAAIFAEVILSDTLGNHVDSVSTLFYTMAKDLLAASDDNIRLFNKLSFMIKPGVYTAVLMVIDAIDKREGSFLYSRIEIDPPDYNNLSLSHLELAYNIKIVEDSVLQNDPWLIKNGREIIPSPMGIFASTDSIIYTYAELYNLYYDEDTRDSFELDYRVYNSEGILYHDFGRMVTIKPGSTAVITNALNVSGWDPGRYELHLIATDAGVGKTTETARPFIIFPKTGLISGLVSYTYSSPLDTAGLKTKTNLIKYLVEPQDWQTFGTLNDTGKSIFIEQFFETKDPTPATKRNEYLEDVFQRYVYACANFPSLPGADDGWRSDRGRVLLQYGQCDKLEEGVMPSYANPLQMWYYYSIQGGVYFIFEDVDGSKAYRLVHSNMPGEIYNQAWEDDVRSVGLDLIAK